MLGDIGGLVKATTLVFGIFLPLFSQGPSYASERLAAMFKIHPTEGYEGDKEKYKFIGANTLNPMHMPNVHLRE